MPLALRQNYVLADTLLEGKVLVATTRELVDITVEESKMAWAQQQRMDFITKQLSSKGYVNRSMLTRYFLIGTAQATRDIRSYREAHPQAMAYNTRDKRYERAL